MIKFNNSNINDWYFYTSDIVKVYRNNAICYYKINTSGDTPTYDLCYAVVNDISSYTDREFVDVFNKADEKWYKLNNLNQYEQYGIYGSGRTICEGSSSRLPQGYTEVEYVENTGTSYVNTDMQIYSSTTNSFEVEAKLIAAEHDSQSYQNVFSCMSEDGEPYQGFAYRYQLSSLVGTSIPNGQNTFTIVNNKDSTQTVTVTSSSSQRTYTHTYPLTLFCGLNSSRNPFRWTNSKFYYCKIKMNDELVRDFVPCKRDSDDKYGMYDLVTNAFYLSPNNVDFSGGEPITPTDCVTTYNGKLTVDDGYEYEWNGSSWVNLGEVSGSTATLPDVPFSVNYNANNYDTNTKTLAKTIGQLVDVDAVITAGTPTVNDGYLTIASGTRATISGYQTYFNRTNTNGSRALTIVSKQRTEGDYCHMFANRDSDYNWMYRCYSNRLTLHGGSETGGVAVTTQPVIESVRVQDSSPMIVYNNYTNNTSSSSSSFNYGSTNSGKFALFQGYATSTGEYFVGDFYWVYMSQNTLTDEQVQQVIDYNEGGGGQSIYPKYYDEIADPLDNLTFNTLEAAEEYAYNNCVYDGMHALIDGDRYVFDSEDGWVVVPEYYYVEDVTPGGASGWTITGSSTYNPDLSYYDDFSVALDSGYQTKVAKVTIFGYENFTYYLRSTGYSNYAYVAASNVDELTSDPTSMNYSSSSAITNTYNFNKAAASAVNLSNYRRVTYNNLDKTVEHTFYVVFYNGYYTSSYPPSATLLIPKEQTNENWEQVTFSASSNVASAQKSLYIDGNSSTSGGTGGFYYRWMLGLPSGSHTSYTNYSNYDYCPNATSSTFTSVAGEQRQVNFTYDSTTNKNLSFRLVDSNGNILTPSDTVYYYIYRYNSCNASTNATISLPTTQSLKVGGRFYFSNSSNRHYIYGYSAPATGTTYYVDNYSSTFDLVYTALTREAVTVTYTTYDPSDAETPAFKTDITWPYSGGTTSSTTLTTYDVPYTYPYVVSQTSDKFSADNQTYTAGQASRTITFTLYPNNREFATVADMEAYVYAWEGMRASVNGTNYQYSNGQWVEKQFNQYEYIRTENNSNRYYKFNTGFYPTTANTIEIKMEMVDTSVDWGAILGWTSCDGDSCDSTQFRFTTVTNGYAIIGRKGNTSGISYKSIGENKQLIVKLPLSASTYTWSTGSTFTSEAYNIGTFTLPSSTPLHLCSIGYTKKAAVMKVYYVKVYDGSNNLVKHYVPSDSNGSPCFYEIVNGEFILDTYTGSNHGTLTLGPQV